MKYTCILCGWEYDEDEGCPEGDIAPGTSWGELPCPICCVGKDHFSAIDE